VKKETLKQKEAFEYYFLLGETRTHKKVAQKFKVSIQTIKRWSSLFRWKIRIQEREARLAEQLQKRIEGRIAKIREENLKIIEAAKIKFIENLKAGMVDPNTIQDLERLIKLELLNLGEATERTENRITVISSIPRPYDN
jgi:hypothetical protein